MAKFLGLELLLIIIYGSIVTFGIYHLSFFKHTGVGSTWITANFWLKIGVGLLYGYVHQHYYNGADTYAYLKMANLIYESLYENPLHYLQLTFGPNGGTPPAHLADIVSQIGPWNDTKTYAMFRINAIIRLFSGGYYSVHALVFNLLAIIGLTGIYKTFLHYIPHAHKRLFFLVFLLPSILFWGSGVHKEALNLCCLGIIFYLSIRFFQAPKQQFLQLIGVSITLLILLLIRPHLCLLLVPALLAWYWTHFRPAYAFLKYIVIYAISITAVVLLGQWKPSLNFFALIAYIQYVYVVYESGSSDIPLALMEPNLLGTLKILPQAFFNTLLRPTWSDSTNWLKGLAALEMLGIWCFIFFSIRKILQSPNPSIPHSPNSWLYFCLFFGLSYILFMGLMVANLGAIVRYRSIGLLFLVGFFVGRVLFLPRLSMRECIDRHETKKGRAIRL